MGFSYLDIFFPESGIFFSGLYFILHFLPAFLKAFPISIPNLARKEKPLGV